MSTNHESPADPHNTETLERHVARIVEYALERGFIAGQNPTKSNLRILDEAERDLIESVLSLVKDPNT